MEAAVQTLMSSYLAACPLTSHLAAPPPFPSAERGRLVTLRETEYENCDVPQAF